MTLRLLAALAVVAALVCSTSASSVPHASAPASDLFTAIRGNRVDLVQQLLEAGVDPNGRDEHGYTPLHVAAPLGNLAVVRALLSHGADPLLLDEAMAATSLHYAVQGGSVEVCRELISANPDVLNLAQPTLQMTPLMSAVWYRNPAVVQQLLTYPHVNANAPSKFGFGARGFLQLLGNETELARQQAAVISGLFDAYEASVAAKLASQDLFTALLSDTLSPSQRLAQVKQLLSAGADPNAVSPVVGGPNDGHTPVLVASRMGLVEEVAALVQAGADVTILDGIMRANPAHKAAYNGHSEVLRELSKSKGWLRVRDQQGGFNGYTPLHDAVWHGHTEAARVLVVLGARKDLRNFQGLTPLQLAQLYKYDDIVDILRSS